MSTTIVTTWATDLSQLGPIYPFVGSEVLMFILGLIFWISFHVIQIRKENQTFKEQIERFGDKQRLQQVVKSRQI
jgi:hypothetical protein|tara:strand:+ start:31 stop:255 length:225 start_codon:yes stop_codon:yes gene_type:complete